MEERGREGYMYPLGSGEVEGRLPLEVRSTYLRLVKHWDVASAPSWNVGMQVTQAMIDKREKTDREAN